MPTTSNRHSNAADAVLAWHGWQLALPDGFDPVRLEGGYEAGLALLADLQRPRMGVKWETPSQKKFDARASVERAMRDEVGRLAAEEATDLVDLDPQAWQSCRLYVEPDPPGRDVFIGYSTVSQRLLQVVFHITKHGGEHTLRDVILRSIVDASAEAEQRWSIFGFRCTIPRRMKLQSQTLLAGDLTLSFVAEGGNELLVREIAVAELALKRSPIEQWLRRQQAVRRKHYRPTVESEPVELAASGDAEARRLTGVRGEIRRRRRFFFLRKLPTALTTLALHDPSRDRLVIVQSGDRALAEQVARSVGR